MWRAATAAGQYLYSMLMTEPINTILVTVLWATAAISLFGLVCVSINAYLMSLPCHGCGLLMPGPHRPQNDEQADICREREAVA